MFANDSISEHIFNILVEILHNHVEKNDRYLVESTFILLYMLMVFANVLTT